MNRSFRFLLRAALAALALATTVSCETAAKSEGTIVSPPLIASAELPFSESRSIALLADGRTACVVDSYEVRVRCVDPDGSAVGLFGGTVSGVEIAARRDAILAGAGPGGYQTFYEIDIETGAVLRQSASPPVSVQVGCGRDTRGPPFKYGLPSPHGGWAFLACAGHMVFAPDRYLGTVQVRDRVWGFDILESTLVVVVDRMPETDEPDALPTRGLDWYDIGDLNLSG